MLNNNEKIIRHKVGLLNLAEELNNVSRACLENKGFLYQLVVFVASSLEAVLVTSKRA